MTQHSHLSAERWAVFSLDEQILMIANELNRTAKLMSDADQARRRHSYERVLRLVDLTIGVQRKRALQKELLRWRDLIAELYLADRARLDSHQSVLRCLLRFTPTASRQLEALSLQADGPR